MTSPFAIDPSGLSQLWTYFLRTQCPFKSDTSNGFEQDRYLSLPPANAVQSVTLFQKILVEISTLFYIILKFCVLVLPSSRQLAMYERKLIGKKLQRSMMVSRSSFLMYFLIPGVSDCCIMIWQSCDFNPDIFLSESLTFLPQIRCETDHAQIVQ